MTFVLSINIRVTMRSKNKSNVNWYKIQNGNDTLKSLHRDCHDQKGQIHSNLHWKSATNCLSSSAVEWFTNSGDWDTLNVADSMQLLLLLHLCYNLRSNVLEVVGECISELLWRQSSTRDEQFFLDVQELGADVCHQLLLSLDLSLLLIHFGHILLDQFPNLLQFVHKFGAGHSINILEFLVLLFESGQFLLCLLSTGKGCCQFRGCHFGIR